MAKRVFHEIFLHLNWHTKGDQPFLDAELEPKVHKYIKEKCLITKGVNFHAVGGTETHVHLVIEIDPQICVSDFMGELKSGSAFEVKKHCKLEWERSFGVVSFTRRKLEWTLEYVAQQKERHRNGKLFSLLEQTEPEEEEEDEDD